jgi:hypothetical protein
VVLRGGVLSLFFRGSSTPLRPATLVLDWPAEERGAAMIHIDGRKRDVPDS